MRGHRILRLFASAVLAVLPACQLIVGSDEPVALELDSLTITPGGLDQTFAPATRTYTATPSYTDAIAVVPRSPDPDATIQVTSSVFPDLALPPAPSGTTHDIPTVAGDNLLTIRVSTPQGVTTTYTVTVSVPGARFGAPEKIPQGGNSASIDIADFDGDGTPDLAVCSNNGVFLFDGVTKTMLGTMLNAAPCLDLAIGDLDGADGPDIVVVTRGSTAMVFLNTGNGTFGAPTGLGGGTEYISVALGDLDGDGDLDLILGDDETGPPFGRVQWRLNAGTGTFGAIVGQVNAGSEPLISVVGELDGDPGTDVMVLDSEGAAIALVQGDGAGQLVTDDATDTSPVPVQETQARSLIRVQADAGPVPDYAVVHGDRNELAVIRNFAGSSTINANLAHDIFPTDAGPTSVAAADLDGDGHEDLIVTCKNAGLGKVTVFYGDGQGGYVPLSFASPSPIGVAVADFNGDALLDLAVLSATSTEGIHILLQEAP